MRIFDSTFLDVPEVLGYLRSFLLKGQGGLYKLSNTTNDQTHIFSLIPHSQMILKYWDIYAHSC